MTARTERGRQAEDLALRFLQRRGLDCVERNYRSRWGEIDLIMLDNETLVVVEVRSRAHARFVAPGLSVDWRKQGKIIRCTEYFLSRNRRFAKHVVRFDVIAVTATSQLEWITNAFEPDY